MEYMRIALEQAKEAFAKKEVPIGAVLVFDNKIIAKGHNQIEFLKDATAHAEILCLREGAKILGDFRLVESTLYVTVEPCLMCFGAATLSRVKKIVWGCSDPRHGALGGLVDLSKLEHPIHQIESIGGVMADEARELIQTFFRGVREWKKSLKR